MIDYKSPGNRTAKSPKAKKGRREEGKKKTGGRAVFSD
jgi:hypothetical protein